MVDRIQDEEERQAALRQEVEDAPEHVAGGMADAAAGATAGGIAILAAEAEAEAEAAAREAEIMDRARDLYDEASQSGHPITGPEAVDQAYREANE